MKNTIQILLTFAMAIGASLHTVAQINFYDASRIKSIDYKISDNTLDVSMTIDIANMQMSGNQTLILTPMLVNGDNVAELPAIEIMARRAYIYYLRNDQQTVTRNTAYAIREARRAESKRGDGTVLYNTSIDYQPWMAQVDVVLRESSCWCTNLPEVLGSTYIANIVTRPPYEPQYIVSFVEPGNSSTTVSQHGSPAYINFRLNSHKVVETYKNNSAELAAIIGFIEHIRQQGNIDITKITIDGWTSPEATVPYNQRLSHQRADALADYIADKTGINRTKITTTGHGEDWVTFRNLVDQLPNLPNKDKVLDIIDDTSRSLDSREWLLSQMHPASIYSRLTSEVYPILRRNDYSIEFSRIIDNPQELEQMILSEPQNVPLGQMYLIAGQYPKGSDEYNRIMEISAKTYPDSVVAAVNLAATRIEANDPDGAIALLEKADTEDVRVLNALGVAYAIKQYHDKAHDLWTRAAQNGSEDAKHNLSELEKATSGIKSIQTVSIKTQ